jgi:hypothetical protein
VPYWCDAPVPLPPRLEPGHRGLRAGLGRLRVHPHRAPLRAGRAPGLAPLRPGQQRQQLCSRAGTGTGAGAGLADRALRRLPHGAEGLRGALLGAGVRAAQGVRALGGRVRDDLLLFILLLLILLILGEVK